jgi:hypothetical protein
VFVAFLLPDAKYDPAWLVGWLHDGWKNWRTLEVQPWSTRNMIHEEFMIAFLCLSDSVDYIDRRCRQSESQGIDWHR